MGRVVIALSVGAVLVAASLAVRAEEAGPVASVDWASDASGGASTLVIHFARGVPRFEVDLTQERAAVWLEGLNADGLTLEGVSATPSGGGVRLEIDRPGARLQSFRMEGDRLVLTVRGGAGAPGERPVPSYLIGVGDEVSLLVYKNPDLSGDLTVAPDGTISVPLVGTIAAAGKTDSELAEEIRRILERDFLVDPQISLSVKTYQSQYVYVTGSVPRSTRVALRPGMILKDVLSEAGVAMAPGQEVMLSRAGGSGEKMLLNSTELESSSTPELRDGDVVTVRDPRYVFVQGEVRRPQRLTLSGEMTLLQAISLCEGLTDWASKHVRIRRKSAEDNEEIRVNLRDVQRGKAPDPVLQPDDIVIVERRVL